MTFPTKLGFSETTSYTVFNIQKYSHNAMCIHHPQDSTTLLQLHPTPPSHSACSFSHTGKPKWMATIAKNFASLMSGLLKIPRLFSKNINFSSLIYWQNSMSLPWQFWIPGISKVFHDCNNPDGAFLKRMCKWHHNKVWFHHWSAKQHYAEIHKDVHEYQLFIIVVNLSPFVKLINSQMLCGFPISRA